MRYFVEAIMNQKLLDDARAAGFSYSEAGKVWIATDTDFTKFAELQQNIPDDILIAAKQIDYELLEIINGRMKPNKFSVEPLLKVSKFIIDAANPTEKDIK